RLYGWEEWLELAPAEGAPTIRTARVRLCVPEVVALQHYDQLPLASGNFSRRNVAKRDHYTCQYCGAQPGVAGLTIDPAGPRSQGGPANWTNWVAACLRCNARKADRTPERAGMRLRKLPTRPEWKPYGTWQGPGHAPRLASWNQFLAAQSARAPA